MKYKSDKLRGAKINKFQEKKHVTQMNNQELVYLTNRLRAYKEVNLSWHLLSNNNRKINKETIQKTMNHIKLKSFIFEYNKTTKGDTVQERVGVVSPYIEYVSLDGKITPCYLSFVIDINFGMVISAWYISIEFEKAFKPNLKRYNENLQII